MQQEKPLNHEIAVAIYKTKDVSLIKLTTPVKNKWRNDIFCGKVAFLKADFHLSFRLPPRQDFRVEESSTLSAKPFSAAGDCATLRHQRKSCRGGRRKLKWKSAFRLQNWIKGPQWQIVRRLREFLIRIRSEASLMVGSIICWWFGSIFDGRKHLKLRILNNQAKIEKNIKSLNQTTSRA